MSKMYIVKTFSFVVGEHDVVDLFVTKNKDFAESYVNRFNDIMSRYKQFYKTLEEHEYPDLLKEPDFIDDDIYYVLSEENDNFFDRWHKLNNFIRCYFEEIEVR